ncbi:septal ring lytic transglycosylase RlpA family protein [Pontibacter ramchanderi]|uniref:Probable endolytic peptidoglycan transglycosylase RlpA n=1 Tax=Pontibacter ramchanderi TaxID=1179743 RepID=A0A2N3UD34_9BACT|nr:septal ring lytic transglycosylase RlpA family protein [Pontibacter ramchanderi]PKV67298.1 rare lipoprotein A [Pontibacter ramchanderi]
MRLQQLGGTFLIALSLLTAGACTTSKPTVGQRGYTEAGKASYYSNKLHGRKMANGEAYNRRKLTAAHRTLPFGTKVKVTNLETKRSVKVSITDRGPFVKGRVIDLSEAAAKRLDYISAGIVPVEVKVVKPAPAR